MTRPPDGPPSDIPTAEEPWEAEISALLRSLPEVEPPDGFLDAAVDHPPLHAGRILAALVAACLVGVLGLTLAVVGPSRSLVPGADGLAASNRLGGDDLRRAVHASNGEAVPVLIQSGDLDWSSLPAEGRRDLAGAESWVDADRDVIVVELDGEVVTIVGLTESEVAELVSGLPDPVQGPADGFRALLTVLAEQLGLGWSSAP